MTISPILRRRQLISFLSLFALASTLPTTIAAGKQTAQVIIIGAGMAGLSAGRFLQSQGIQPLILEARPRLGGRIWTDRTWGFPIDLGAGWIHTPDGNPITPLARQAGAKTFVTDDQNVLIFDPGGKRMADAVVSAHDRQYTELMERIEVLVDSSPRDISMQEAIRRINPQLLQSPALQYRLSSYLEFTTGGTIDTLSAKSWNSDREFAGADVILANGYDAVVNLLAQGLTIQTGQVVQKVHYDQAKVRVTTNLREFTADRVIVTVPLGVLKHKSISWQPALPQNLTNLIDRVGMGIVNKVALLFPSAFWDTAVQYFGFYSPVMGKYNYFVNTRTFSSANALITFALGSYGAQVEKQPDRQIQQQVMEHLQLMFGNRIPQPKQMLVTKWGSDPFSRGAYSYPRVGVTNQDFQNLGAVVNDRLFFAGEHTHPTYRASVHGAYLSGQRSAQQVIDSLG